MNTPKGLTKYEEAIDVPRGTGIAGFLQALREVLKLPRVQGVRIDSNGRIEYDFFLREGEEKKTITMNFDELMPAAIVRNSTVVEIPNRSAVATVAIFQMFTASSIDSLFPIAFVTGLGSSLWSWIGSTADVPIVTQESLFGLPVHQDRGCPDEALILCSAFKRDSELAEMKKAYKIDIPQVTK